jgi:ABC-type multidrug transport system ATPase subunit
VSSRLTSGLDDFGARFTMELVLKYVKSENVCVVIVIHQPCEAVFKLFDNAMIICEGRTCYFGPVAASESYFGTMGYPTPKLQNPIEHYREFFFFLSGHFCSWTLTETNHYSFPSRRLLCQRHRCCRVLRKVAPFRRQ